MLRKKHLLGAVRYAVDPAEALCLHGRLRIRTGVGRQVVHEDADLLIGVGSSKPCEPLRELGDVDTLREICQCSSPFSLEIAASRAKDGSLSLA